KIENGSTQRAGILFKLIEKEDAKQFRANVTFPAGHDLCGVRAEEHAGIQQVANHFVRIGDVKWIDVLQAHSHGQLGPCPFHRVARDEDDPGIWKTSCDALDEFFVE